MLKKIIFLSCFLLLLFFATSVSASEASVQISPLQGTYNEDQTFTVDVWVKTGGYSVGQVSADISFSEDFLQVVSISLADYFKSTNEYGVNNFDNEKGNIHVEGEIENGLKEDGSLATITFKVKKSGTARIDLFKTTRVLTTDNLTIPLRTADSVYQLEKKGTTSVNIQQVNITETDEGGYKGISNSISTSSILIGQPPQLFGKTDTPNALIEFDVDQGLAIGKTTADQQGDWNWSLSRRLLPGIYAVKITATNPQDKKKKETDWQEVEMRIMDVSRQLYKIIVVSSTLPKNVYPNSKLPINFKIINLGNASSTNQLKNTFRVSYYIEDPSRSLIYDNQEDVVFTGQDVTLTREIEISKEAVKGNYTIYATMKLDDELVSMDSATFKVRASTYKYLIIGVALVAVFFVGWAVFRKLKTRK